MAQGRVFYARYAGDFIVGTQLMDLETRGAYSLVIDLLNDRDRPIPDDPKFMSRFLNITQQRWRKIRSVLIREGKIYIDAQGCITNPRFERELARRRGISEVRAEARREGGKRSGEARRRQPELPLPAGDFDLADDQPENEIFPENLQKN